MQRTISIKLITTPEQESQILSFMDGFSSIRNKIAKISQSNKCSNRVALHHLCYYQIREEYPEFGSQMVCNAVKSVASAYKALNSRTRNENKRIASFNKKPKNKNKQKKFKPYWADINFKPTSSIHFDKRTYSIKKGLLSLFTPNGRLKLSMKLGEFQNKYLQVGTPKEAELVYRNKTFYFNLVLDIPDIQLPNPLNILGVDLGENNIATLSSGKIISGGQIRSDRDKYLALRSRLQRNGSKSAKQHLKKVSGRESRHVTHVNHIISKSIVIEAKNKGYDTIAMEELTGIRESMNYSKEMNTRLHRWSWKQLQSFIEYKANNLGINVIYVAPAYTSQTCSSCGNLGERNRHRFYCKSCGRLAHADFNASQNIASLGRVFTLLTGEVNHPNVAVRNN